MTTLFVTGGVALIIIALLIYAAIPSKQQQQIDNAVNVDYNLPEPEVAKYDAEEERLIAVARKLSKLPTIAAIPSKQQQRLDNAKDVNYKIPEPEVQNFNAEEERLIEAARKLSELPTIVVLHRYSIFVDSKGPFSDFQLEYVAAIESELRYRLLLAENQNSAHSRTDVRRIKEALGE